MIRASVLPAVLFFCAVACREKTDRELIDAVIDQTIAAANEKRAGGVVEGAAEGFKGPQGADLRECRRILTGYFLQHGWLRVLEQSRTIDVPSATTATVKLDVFVAVGRDVKELEDLIPTNGTHLLFDLTLEKIDGAWRYQSATYEHVR